MKTSNRNRVPQKQWRKWSMRSQSAFNEVYGFMMRNPGLMTHPKAPAIKPLHWKTIAWNAAWIAADAIAHSLPTDIVTLDDGRPVRRQKVA